MQTASESTLDNTREVIESVQENRVSPLLVHALIGVSLLFLPLVAQIPMSVLFGLFLFMGFATLAGNEFFEETGGGRPGSKGIAGGLASHRSATQKASSAVCCTEIRLTEDSRKTCSNDCWNGVRGIPEIRLC